MPAAAEDGWTLAAKQRLANALGPKLEQRLVLFRRLKFAEFSALAARAHVVLDPFPVGGGRSALEVFGVATPIVVLYPKTSILQLAAGFYMAMGMEEGPVPAGGEYTARTRTETRAIVGSLDDSEAIDVIVDASKSDNNDYDRGDGADSTSGEDGRYDPAALRLSTTTGLPSLIAHSPKEFVRIAVAVASNTTLRSVLSATIATAAPLSLYHQQGVVEEWAEFLTFASAAPRPPPRPWWQPPTMPRNSSIAVNGDEHDSGGGNSGNAGGPEDALSARDLFGDVAVPMPTEQQLERAVALAVAADARWQPSAANAHSAQKMTAKTSAPDGASFSSSNDEVKEDSDVNYQQNEVDDHEETSSTTNACDSLAELASSVPASIVAERLQPLTLQVARNPTEWGFVPTSVPSRIHNNEHGSKHAQIWVNSGPTKRKSSLLGAPSRGWHWAPRSFGWEVVYGDPPEGYEGGANERAAGLLYALKLSAEDNSDGSSSGNGPSVSFLVEIWANGPNPAAVASQLGHRIGAEPVKEAWLACVLARGATLSDGLVETIDVDERAWYKSSECSVSSGRAPLVWAMPLQLVDAADSETTLLSVAIEDNDGNKDGTERSFVSSHPPAGLWGSRAQPQIEVRLGDDVTQLAAWAAYRLDLGVDAASWLRARLERLTPERSSPAWLKARAQRHCLHLPWPPLHNTTPQHQPPAHEPKYTPSKQARVFKAALGSPPTSETAYFGDRDRSSCCRITVGITTCRRLPLFMVTAKSLLAELGDNFQPGGSNNGYTSDHHRGNSNERNNSTGCPLVCRVVVVDDGSSPEDVATMRKEFPFFEYMLKPLHRKGHANSLNLLLDLVANDVTQSEISRQNLQYDSVNGKFAANATTANPASYFLYLEDDWLWREGSAEALREAVALLDASRELRTALLKHPKENDHHRHAQNKEELTAGSNEFVGVAEPLEQVLLNDQASRACAYADPLDVCASTPLGAAGWPRTAHLPVAGMKFGADEGRSVDYRLHEFGTLGEDHAFGYWPGFTLNPALWDVTAMQAKLRAHQQHCQFCEGVRSKSCQASGCSGYSDAHLQFNASDLRFEQSMSLKLATAGVRVAYLQRLSVQHLGTEASAYELNGLTRPWDRQSPSDTRPYQ